MSDLLGEGSDWLEEMRHAYMSHPVEYARDSQTISIDATVGRTFYDLPLSDGLVQRTEARDFLIRSVDLVFGEPSIGDRITDDGGIYEVASYGGSPHWQFSDQNRRTMRIHTIQVASLIGGAA